MSTSSVVQIFDSEERARDAVAKLKAAGFADDAISTVTPGGADAVASALLAGRRMGHAAGFYAERLRQGRSLVVVEAPFGRAQLARSTLIEAGAVDVDLRIPEEPSREEWGQAAPLSAAFGWRVLSRNNPTPLSDALALNVFTRVRFFLTRGLADPSWFPTRVFGPLLAGGEAPMRSRLGLPLLIDDAAPLSSRFGLPLLSRKPPNVDVAAWSREPAPLSSALGLPVLTRRQ